MTEEITFVDLCPALFAQPTFQRSQRTDPAAELDEGSANNYKYVKSNDRPRFV